MACVRGLVVFGCCLVAPVPACAQEPTKRQLLEAFQEQLKTAYAAAAPSIACVVVSRSEFYPKAATDTPGKLGGFDRKEFLKTDKSGERQKLATVLDLSDPRTIPDHGYVGGVVIDPAGLVLAPYHAIEGATKIYVFLPGRVGSYADVHAADSRCDLAVLKLINPPANLKAIKFADVRIAPRGDKKATVFPGKLVMLLANPYTAGFVLDKPGGEWGSITNVHYRVPPPRDGEIKSDNFYKYGELLEHDVKLNAAVTGGVLVNLDGEMVGMTTAAATAYDNRTLGPGYAIPADENFRRVLEVLRRGEEVEFGFLGVTLGRQPGIVIGSVVPGGPAQKAQIEPGDVITHINGQPAENYDDLLLQVGFALAGGKVKMKVLSPFNGQSRDVEVTLGKWRHTQPYIASVRPEPVFGLRVDHGSVLAQQLNPPGGNGAVAVEPGVCVREVVPNSAAATKFKALGDSPTRWLIAKVNGAPVTTPAEFYRAAQGQKSVRLTLVDPTDANRREREITLP
jgi:serine protease Do